MSYDLLLFRPEPGVDPLDTVKRVLLADEEEINPGPVLPETEERKSALIAILRDVNRGLMESGRDHEAIAHSRGIPIEEARRQYRHRMLDAGPNGNGIQIMLFDDTASITIPYWHTGAAARAAFGEIWNYLILLERKGGLATYDPQLERILDPATDMPEVIAGYEETVARVRSMIDDPR